MRQYYTFFIFEFENTFFKLYRFVHSSLASNLTVLNSANPQQIQYQQTLILLNQVSSMPIIKVVCSLAGALQRQISYKGPRE